VAVLVASALAFAGYALAASVSITIGASGPQPAATSVSLGDTLTFTNGDKIAHIVASKRLGWTAPAMAPGGTYTYVATVSGSWGYEVSDTAGKNRTSGTFKVAKVGTVSLVASAGVVDYGKSVVLRGKTSLPTFPVLVEENIGKGWEEIDADDITPAADGSFSVAVRPEQRTQYRANVLDGELLSSPPTVLVKPRLTMRASARKVATGKEIKFTAKLVPARAAKQLELQRYDKAQRTWHRLGTGKVSAAGTFVISVAIPEGRSVIRVAVPHRSSGKDFAASVSKWIPVVGVGAEPKKAARRGKHSK
jgi:plastocyanin